MRRPTPSSAPVVAPVVTALVVPLALVLAGCTGTSGPAAPADPTPSPASAAAVDRVDTVGRIPDDFPLTSGWEAGLEAPRRGDADLPTCDDGSGDPPNATGTDRLVAHWSRRSMTRQVTLYPDRAAARAAVRALLDHYRDCPAADDGERPSRGTTTVELAAASDAGESRWEVLRTRADEDGVLGGHVLQVVRVGRAVLLDAAGGRAEGERGWARRARAISAEQVTWGAAVVAAMGEL